MALTICEVCETDAICLSSSTMEETFYHYGPVQRKHPLQATFLSQPPEDLRKSNFFNFSIELREGNHLVHVEEARFLEFLNENEAGIRNGIKYIIKFKYASGMTAVKHLYLTLVDASNHEPIRYEGYDDSRKMQRVLLTHETICTRCSQQKSCGNKSEAPSDPRMTSIGVLQFFLKCNQNCLKGAGNPRDMRRFALALSFEDITHNRDNIVAVSNKIFVHNNSKHSRKRKREDEHSELEPILKPADITYIYPKTAHVDEPCFTFHSKQWCQVGVSFRAGNLPLHVTSLIKNVAMTVQFPPTVPEGRMFITMFFKESPVFTFPYEILNRAYSPSNRTTGFLILRQHGQIKEEQMFEPGSDHNQVIYVQEGAQVPGCYYENNTYCPFNYGSGAFYSHSSSSSQSPTESHLSCGSESPPNYMPHGPLGWFSSVLT